MSAVAERTRPRLTIRAGFAWMTHRELSMVQYGTPVVCEGTIRFVHTHGHHKEARCDACSFTVAATARGVREAVEQLEQLRKTADFNREGWWQK